MKICIIKLGALGDVIRTIPIAKAIKDTHKNAELTWLTKPHITDILQTHKFINKIITSKPEESFDILYNFDIEPEATSLAQSIPAEKKLGFYTENNYTQAFNLGAEQYLNTLFDDEIKKSNTLTYQELMFKTAEIQPTKNNPQLNLPQKAIDYAAEFKIINRLKTEKLIGIHMGASPRWPSKIWHPDSLKQFIKLAKQKNYNIILFGGPDEIDKISPIARELNITTNNPNNSNLEFASLVNLCKTIICSDSFALHIALSLNKPTIALFFVTSANEVEPYNLLTKLTAPKQKEFFPEKCDQYSEELTKSITPQQVLESLEKIIQ